MSDLQIDEQIEVSDLDNVVVDDGEKFCHIDDGSDLRCYCGYINIGPHTCQPYNGEAICPSCGRVNCPTCIEMASLNDRLVD